MTSSSSPSTARASSPGSPDPAGSTMIPSWSSPMPSSRDEQIIPADTWPYVLRAEISTFPGSTPPGRTTTTRSPGAKLCAPQTMPWGSPVPLAAPTSTVHQLIVLPFFCGSGSMVSTRPTTSGPVMSEPARWIDSSLRPRAVRRCARSSVDTPAGRSTYSRIQETGAFISDLRSEGAAEADVALEEAAQVLDAVAEHQGAVDAHAEGEAGVALGVDAARDQHAWVDHAAAAPLDPALASTRATGAAVEGPAAATHEAHQVDLGARLGEREVRRPEPGRDALAEHR